MDECATGDNGEGRGEERRGSKRETGRDREVSRERARQAEPV